MVYSYREFINETKDLALTFKVDDKGNVDILGKNFQILDLLSKYDHIIEYAFATYLDKKLMYFPEKKIFKQVKTNIDRNATFNISPDRVKWRSVKVMPEFISGMELDMILTSTQGAADYTEKNNHIDILDSDGKIIKSYDVDPKTGKLS